MDKPLQRIDHIMWDAETPNSPVTIAGIMVFKKPLSKDKLLGILEQRLMRFTRFQKKVVLKDGKPMWHKDEQFHLPSHLHHIALPGRGGYAELQACISDLISQPLHYHKPLWDMHLIDNYKGGSVLLCRVHHALGDGMALVKVIFSLTGASSKESLVLSDDAGMMKRKNTKGDIEQIIETGRKIYDDARKMLFDPALLRDTLTNNWTMAKEVTELFVGKPVTNTIYKGQLGVAKKAAWTEPLSLSSFRAIAKEYGTTINDVLLALVAGAVRKHLLLHKQKTDEGLKVVVPVNMRKGADITNVHNEFSWLSLDLPVHMSSFKNRIEMIHKITSELKPSAEAMFLDEVLHLVADYTPAKLKQAVIGIMGKHIAGVVTNVPGPGHPIYMAGSEVEDIMFWVPHTVALGIGISLMSYNGKVCMGIVTDIGLVTDPDVVIHAFTAEFSKLEKKIVG